MATLAPPDSHVPLPPRQVPGFWMRRRFTFVCASVEETVGAGQQESVSGDFLSLNGHSHWEGCSPLSRQGANLGCLSLLPLVPTLSLRKSSKLLSRVLCGGL